MDLFLATCQGIGLALAAGIGGYVAVLVACVLAHVGLGWDLDGTSLEWFASSWFIPLPFVGAVGCVASGRPVALGARGLSEPVGLAGAALIVALGAVAFAGSLAEGGFSWWPGLPAGAAITGATVRVAAPLAAAASSREGASGFAVALIAGAGGALLVVVSLLAPPASLAALAAFALVGRGRRRKARAKHAGLRSLR